MEGFKVQSLKLRADLVANENITLCSGSPIGTQL